MDNVGKEGVGKINVVVYNIVLNNNKFPISLRNIKARILDKELEKIPTMGKSTLTILLK